MVAHRKMKDIHMLQTVYAPVFDAPATPGSVQRSKRPVDLTFLAQQTGGDKALEEEVLQLFLVQAHKLSTQIEKSCQADGRRADAHTLKGAARAIGAGSIAQCAGALEDQPMNTDCVRALVDEVATTCDYIASLMR